MIAANIVIGARGSFHYPLVDKLDTYTGLMLGFAIHTSKEHGNNVYGINYNPYPSRPVLTWYAGARYYVKDNIAALAEIGYGISWLNIGVSYKF